jgi:hypothetical protein
MKNRGKIVKCANHPGYDAMAMCPSCGKQICEFCSVNIFNMPHCKECTENLVLHMSKLPKRRFRKNLPRKRRLKAMKKAYPTGRLNRNFFIIGSIGSLLIAITTFFLGWSFSIPRDISFSSYPWWLIQLSILTSIGMIITAFGFYGFYRNYGTTLGLITSISLMIGSFWLPFFIFNSILDISWWEETPFRLGVMFSGAIYTIGMCLVLMGAVLLNVKNITGARILSKTAGVAGIGSSLLFFAITPAHVAGVAWFAFSASSIIMALVFFSAKPYTENNEENTPYPSSNLPR